MSQWGRPSNQLVIIQLGGSSRPLIATFESVLLSFKIVIIMTKLGRGSDGSGNRRTHLRRWTCGQWDRAWFKPSIWAGVSGGTTPVVTYALPRTRYHMVKGPRPKTKVDEKSNEITAIPKLLQLLLCIIRRHGLQREIGSVFGTSSGETGRLTRSRPFRGRRGIRLGRPL